MQFWSTATVITRRHCPRLGNRAQYRTISRERSHAVLHLKTFHHFQLANLACFPQRLARSPTAIGSLPRRLRICRASHAHDSTSQRRKKRARSICGGSTIIALTLKDPFPPAVLSMAMKRTKNLAFFSSVLPLILIVHGCRDADDSTNGQPSQAHGTGGGSTIRSSDGTGGTPLSSAAGGTSSQTSQTPPAGDDLLVDDFEDGDDQPLLPGGWYGYTDSTNGGNSTLTFAGAEGSSVAMNGVGFESSKSLEVAYTFDQGTYEYDPYVGFGASIGEAASPYDLSQYAGLSYTYKGGAHTVRIETTEVTDYDVFGVGVSASATWKTVTFPFKNFVQEGWGTKVSFEPGHALSISFGLRGATGGTGSLQIDNLKAVKTLGEVAPDMVIKEASPPLPDTIESIEIGNPLQAKAMQYLTQGYNITNWLEQEQFAGFDYDESFVQKLAQAGYKGLRLPIDLDRYVDAKTGSGDDLELTVNADLFSVLDAFDTWTKQHGLSLTIDYHQYSSLLDKSDPDSLATAVKIWGKVAEHFAANPREDLFFELLNEPELSFDEDPTKAEWTALAERMVASIRAHDTVHTVIFGGTNWYGIDDLTSRTPLSDSNVIYAFHTYDPFIFTHQGASWANMASTHDLPYPYDASRWSQYYSDLGFNTSMESWILTAAKNYFREGNKAALRNKIVEAKRWAVSHDVPVICNEFGAYEQRSQLADRIRYYTDIIDIFAELAIPWQHWFMLMDETSGEVIPEYRTALGLSPQ